MKIEQIIIALALLFLFPGCDRSNSLERFKGMWRLDKYEALDSLTSTWRPAPKRIGYSGYILYDGAGHVGVQLMPPGFEKLNISNSVDSLTVEQLKEITMLQSKCFVYFANCAISEDIIEHRIQMSNHPDEIGTTVKRHFEFKGDTLILTASERIGGSKTRLRWIRY